MNTYKIKAMSGRSGLGLTLRFSVDAKTLSEAQTAAKTKLKGDGYPYAIVETITEVGPSKVLSSAEKVPSHAKTPLPNKCQCVTGCDYPATRDGMCPMCKDHRSNSQYEAMKDSPAKTEKTPRKFQPAGYFGNTGSEFV